MGMEGMGFQGNLYFKNKKVGVVIDDASGAPIQIHFDEQEKEDKFTKDTIAWGQVYGRDSFMIDEIFVSELQVLKSKEKMFKKAKKEGYKGIVYLTDRYKEDLHTPRKLDKVYSIPEQCTEEDVEQGEYDKKEYYTSLEDFDLEA